MLAEFLKAIRDLSVQAESPGIVLSDAFPKRAMVAWDGQLEQLDIPAPLRNHQLEDLDSLIGFASDGIASPNPEVFCGAGVVIALCDRADRRDRATLKLVYSECWMRLQRLGAKPEPLSSKMAIRFLRYEINSPNTDSVIAALRRLDFSRSSTGRAHVDHGKETLGRSVEMAVQKAEDIPQEFAVVVTVYQTRGAQQRVELRLGLEIDLESETVILRVMPDELARAEEVVQSQIHAALMTQLPTVPIFRGRVG